MAVKLRLQRHGRKQAPFYHIVAADSRSPRDGRFIEKIGTYNPLTIPATIELDSDAALSWIAKGAQPTDTVRSILRFKGVMYRKHLLRGVKKGALTQEAADEMYAKWLDGKGKEIDARIEKVAAKKEETRKFVFGTPKPKAAPVVEEAPAEETPAEDAPAAEE